MANPWGIEDVHINYAELVRRILLSTNYVYHTADIEKITENLIKIDEMVSCANDPKKGCHLHSTQVICSEIFRYFEEKTAYQNSKRE
jgi:hypothetical protein